MPSLAVLVFLPFVSAMPPKTKLGAAPVYRMSHEEQVRLLSDALLREFMHRRGFTKTLQKFDEEHPRDEDTVSSRAVMGDLMALSSSDQQRLKGEGIETIMEMLCSLRVERRQQTEELQAKINKPIPEVPEIYLRLIAKQEEQKAIKRKAREQSNREGREGEMAGEGKLDNSTSFISSSFDELSRVPAIPLTIRRNPTSSHGSSLSLTQAPSLTRKGKASLNNDSLLSSSKREPRVGIALDIEKEMTLDELLNSDSDARKKRNNEMPLNRQSENNSHASLRAKRMGGGSSYSSGPGVQAEWENERLSSQRIGKSRSAEQEEEDLLLGVQHYELEKVGESYEEACKVGAPCSSEDLLQAFYALCGQEQMAPPLPFLEQGLRCADAIGVRLIQWKKGPDAVIAVIQALAAGFYYERSSVIEAPGLQLRSLVKALSCMLQYSQPNVEKVIVVDGRLRLHAPPKLFLEQLKTQYKQWSGFNNVSEIEYRLEKIIESHWRRPKGSGLWCFLLSLLLSRGISAIKADGGSFPLINAVTKTGTSSLLHFCLCGTAKDVLPSSPGTRLSFQCGLLDGDKSDSFTSSTSSLASTTSIRANALGFLVRDESVEETNASKEEDGLDEKKAPYPSGTCLQPILPTWVIKCGEKYCNIYMKRDTRKVFDQERALGGTASVSLTFWDPLTGEDEMTAEVRVTGTELWGAGLRRPGVASSFVERAILTVPEWREGLIDWKGKAPSL